MKSVFESCTTCSWLHVFIYDCLTELFLALRVCFYDSFGACQQFVKVKMAVSRSSRFVLPPYVRHD